MCKHKFKKLWYASSECGCSTAKVCLEKNYDNKPGTLVYCAKCGQVFVKEIAEKIREE